jgi:hypothetical protein
VIKTVPAGSVEPWERNETMLRMDGRGGSVSAGLPWTSIVYRAEMYALSDRPDHLVGRVVLLDDAVDGGGQFENPRVWQRPPRDERWADGAEAVEA